MTTTFFYVVEVAPTRSYGSLHTLTAQHLLTARPSPGDRVFAVGYVTHHNSTAGLREYVEGAHDQDGLPTRYRVTSHPGRAPLLGEDDLDEASTSSLGTLAAELLNGEAGWVYAPVELVPMADDEEPRHVYLRFMDGAWCVVPESYLAEPHQ